jgi:hypothetical protein
MVRSRSDGLVLLLAPCFEVTIENDLSLTGLGALLLGSKERQDHCWEQFIRRCCGTSVLEAGTQFQTMHEGCHHFNPDESTRMIAVRMRVKDLSETTAKLSFDHVAVALERGSESLMSTCERDVVCVQQFGSRFLPKQWPEEIKAQLRQLL